MLTLDYSGKQIILEKRGLGIEVKGKLAFSTLPDVPVSGRIFTKEQIEENRRQFAAGKRRAAFSAVSGYEYLGTILYLLLRWDEAPSRPWLEAVVALDLSQEPLQPRLVGRLPGFSLATGQIDDRLDSRAGDLIALNNRGEDWGLASFRPATGETEFLPWGPRATSGRFMAGGSRAAGLSRTAYGTTLVTWASLADEAARPALEVRGGVRGLIEPGILRYRQGSATILVNLETGAELRPGWDPVAVSTRRGLLVWSPAENPKEAQLLEPASFRALASWKKPTEAVESEP